MTFSPHQLRRCTVAVDMGTARTRVHVREAGIIVDAPSVVAVNTYSGSLIAVGAAAEQMEGRTPDHIRVVRPVAGGTVVDVEMAQRMLRAMVGEKVRRAWRRRPMLRAAVCVPHDADPLARRAAVETLAGVGAKRVELVDAPTAAGVGCGLPVEQPEATMILVCGATTTQVAVLSLGSVVSATTVPMGGDTIHTALVQHLRNEHEVLLLSQSVRPLHAALHAAAGKSKAPTEVHGRDVLTGLARTVWIDPDEVRAAVHIPVTGLIDAIRTVLHRCPPDLVADLADRGMMLAGGSAVLPGLDVRLREATGMAVHIAEDPAGCAVRGLAALMDGTARPLTVRDDGPGGGPDGDPASGRDGRRARRRTAGSRTGRTTGRGAGKGAGKGAEKDAA
ncbi:rod shape-determining protein [Streptomyces sp. JJ36]|uniref:rod shape-determining protein n=1 Tax=Streptomyces sp. JJ36 TaxID=2736645 RepID=UPI001F3B9359|nr:rod shape-determining protein [Streptomyces sp. JJ36]MCF6524992.1 rod shape-determining protein [Streptomyces sp. JJ36]